MIRRQRVVEGRQLGRRSEGKEKGALAKKGIFVLVIIIVVAFLAVIATKKGFSRGFSSLKEGFLSLPEKTFQVFKGQDAVSDVEGDGDQGEGQNGDQNGDQDDGQGIDLNAKFSCNPSCQQEQLERETEVQFSPEEWNEDWNYQWKIRDEAAGEIESKSGGKSFEYTFSDLGDYRVILEVTRDNNLKSRSQVLSIVPKELNAGFNCQPEVACVRRITTGTEVEFSPEKIEERWSYDWSVLNSQGEEIGYNPNGDSFASPGYYLVNLTVSRDADGATSLNSKFVTVVDEEPQGLAVTEDEVQVADLVWNEIISERDLYFDELDREKEELSMSLALKEAAEDRRVSPWLLAAILSYNSLSKGPAALADASTNELKEAWKYKTLGTRSVPDAGALQVDWAVSNFGIKLNQVSEFKLESGKFPDCFNHLPWDTCKNFIRSKDKLGIFLNIDVAAAYLDRIAEVWNEKTGTVIPRDIMLAFYDRGQDLGSTHNGKVVYPRSPDKMQQFVDDWQDEVNNWGPRSEQHSEVYSAVHSFFYRDRPVATVVNKTRSWKQAFEQCSSCEMP